MCQSAIVEVIRHPWQGKGSFSSVSDSLLSMLDAGVPYFFGSLQPGAAATVSTLVIRINPVGSVVDRFKSLEPHNPPVINRLGTP